MGVLIDTSVLVDLERGGLDLAEAVPDADRTTSVMSMSELLHGLHRATEKRIRMRRLAFIEYVMGTFEPLPVTLNVARLHATLLADLQRRGTPVGLHDLWIAATAITHGHRLATSNLRHFERVPGLDVVAL